MIYLDTSAFIKLYFLEEGSGFVQTCIEAQDEPLPVWHILKAEFMNACRLKVYWGSIEQHQADQLIELFDDRLTRGQYRVADIAFSDMMTEFRRLSNFTQELGCRTLDILHVACALLLEAESFVSYDVRQCALAKKAGMSVLPDT